MQMTWQYSSIANVVASSTCALCKPFAYLHARQSILLRPMATRTQLLPGADGLRGRHRLKEVEGGIYSEQD